MHASMVVSLVALDHRFKLVALRRNALLMSFPKRHQL